MKSQRLCTLFLAATLCSFATAPSVRAGDADGSPEVWVGALDTGAATLRLELHVTRTQDDELQAELVSLDQGNVRLPINRISFADGVLAFSIDQIGASYQGTLDETGAVAEGTWTQSGVQLPLTLTKTDPDSRQPDEPSSSSENRNVWENRPQRPEPPFPYTAEDVTFENTRDGVTLAATLTLPRTPGTHPAVILISGSGAQDRDETLMEHKPFLVLADYLSRRGIAVLRYDDRGFGQSTGDFSVATPEDFARDASAAVDFLKRHSRIDAANIELVGHSEGGLVAPLVAADRDDVAFIVLMAGPGVDGATTLSSQSAAMARAGA